ncbi:MAG TPA: hypothetical protein VF715_11330 [Thermoleophilaceae bacterium]
MTLLSQGRLTVLLTIIAVAFAAAAPASAGPGDDHAQGTGTIADPNAPGTSFQFNFNAIGDTDSAKGTLRLVNRSTGTKIRGEVICLQLEGPRRAVIAGRITSIQGAPPYDSVEPGDAFLLFAEDNGKSKTLPDSLVPFLFIQEPPTAELCNADQAGQSPIERGHITIRDR